MADPVPTRRPRKRANALTLADVARLAGVSPITVSRALNSPGQLTADTLAKVREAVERTGYVPNRIAGGLASARSGLVAAIVPTIASQVFLETVETLTSALDEAGYQVMLGQSGYGQGREDDLIDAIIGRRPDGVILTGVMHSPEGRRRLSASGIPIVETWDLTPTPIDMLVGFSHEKVGTAVAEFLHYRGARRPALLHADDHRATLRRTAFAERMGRFGIHDIPVELVPTPATMGAGRRAFGKLVEEHPGIDAVFCSSDILALGALLEAQARQIPVPGQIRVMGFGDTTFAADAYPALSSVRIDGTAIGLQAARFIVDAAAGRPIPERVVDLGFKIIGRQSA